MIDFLNHPIKMIRCACDQRGLGTAEINAARDEKYHVQDDLGNGSGTLVPLIAIFTKG